jgi:hypothetical protein
LVVSVGPQPIPVQLIEEIGQRLLADAPDPLRGELEATFSLIDETGVGQLLGQLRQPVQRTGGVVPEVAPHLFDVDLGQRSG